MSKRLTIDEMVQIAQMRGGKCLSQNYINSKTKLLWECQEGHQWETTPNNVKKGSWCPICGNAKCNEDRKLGIEEMTKIARTRGGKCISDVYVNTKTKLLWECACGHRWESTPGSIKGGNWCKKCSGLERLTIEKMSEIAEMHGGKCLSEKYINSRTKLIWECQKGHKWEAPPASIKRGQWCPFCGGTARLTIEEMKKIAIDRGGKCLSEAYINQRKKLLWECAKGHQWKSTPGSIKGGSWCPECKTGLGERICREFFQQIFDAEFPKCRPQWLLSEKGYKMELDGYCAELGIAFEHQGQEHYEVKHYTINSQSALDERKKKDRLKRKLCLKNNVVLIEIPEVPTLLPIQDIKHFIEKEFRGRKIRLPNEFGSKQIDIRNAYCSYYNEEAFKALKKIAKSKEGRCLSDSYTNSETNLLWECKQGHHWEAPPIRIKSGYWCPHCAGNLRLSLKDMQNIAESRGGKCLSVKYINSRTNLTWECAKGHIWGASPSSVKSGRWCKQCAGLERLSIDAMIRIAKSKGGKCLSSDYINKDTKLLWECAKGHQWEATPGSIKNGGKWCPICANNNRKLTIEEMNKIADERGGKCLSDTYINSYTKLLWECAKGHQWETTPGTIKKGRWCPVCWRTKRQNIKKSHNKANSADATNRTVD